MLNLQISTVVLMTKKKKKKNMKKKIMRVPRFEPGSHRFQVHHHTHHAREANA